MRISVRSASVTNGRSRGTRTSRPTTGPHELSSTSQKCRIPVGKSSLRSMATDNKMNNQNNKDLKKNNNNKSGRNKLLHGVYAPVPTPFDQNEKIDWKALEFNLKRWAASKIDGIVVMGSNGEFPFLSTEEKRDLLRCVADVMKKQDTTERKWLIAGTGAPSTIHSIEMCEFAHQLGYDAAMIVTPYYFSSLLTPQVLTNHYTEVASSSSLPIVLYNVPAFAGVNMAAGTVAALSKHKNIIGIKDTSGNLSQLSDIVFQSSVSRGNADFGVMAGSGGLFLPSLLSGAAGGIMALANFLPDYCAKLFRLYQENRLEEAAAFQRDLFVINNSVMGLLGVSGVKAAMDITGFKGGKPRRPLPPLTSEQQQSIQDQIKKFLAQHPTAQ